MVQARFVKGEIVKVMNPNSHFYQGTGEIRGFDQTHNLYYVLMEQGGLKEVFPPHELARVLSIVELKELKRCHLMQLADLALSIRDEGWFNQISKELKVII